MDYTPPFAARAHQAEGLRRLRAHDNYALLQEMGCVDAETEYLSPHGWVPMDRYRGGLVAQFELDGTAKFVEPFTYVKKPCAWFWHYRSTRGLDQALSPEHRILFCGHPGDGRRVPSMSNSLGRVPPGFRNVDLHYTSHWRETNPTIVRNPVHVPTSFWLLSDSRVDLTDAQIRLQVAFHADGSYGRRDLTGITSRREGCVSVKRPEKKKRMRQLLSDSGVVWREKEKGGGFTLFLFRPPLVSKRFGPEWWQASFEQRRIICDEVWRWDGKNGVDYNRGFYYSSVHEEDADFIQWCFSSTGHRCVKRSNTDGTWSANTTGAGRTSNLVMMCSSQREKLYPRDKHMYCFSVPSGYLIFRRKGCVFVSGNTGKTKEMIDEWGELATDGDVLDMLVIAPSGVYRNWEGEIRKHADPALWQRADVLWWNSAGEKAFDERVVRFLQHDPSRPRVLLMNIEALARVARASVLAETFMRQRGAIMCVDESPIIKNPDSSWTEACMNLRLHAVRRRIATGLVSPQSPLDLYSQFAFLNWRILGYRNYFAFRHHFAVVVKKNFTPVVGRNRDGTLRHAGRSVPLVVGYRNEEELAELIAPHSYRVRKEECLDLPPKVYSPLRHVSLHPDQLRVYEQLRRRAFAELDEQRTVTATMAVTRLMRLQQVLCGWVKDDAGEVTPVPSRRMDELMQVLGEHSGKAIIWTGFDACVREISERLTQDYGAGSVARFWGGNVKTREDEERMFQEDARCRFMVATQAAGGRGRTWTAADLVVYYSNTFDLDHRLQSEDRAHRDGQTRAVTYVDLHVPGTVDEKQVLALRAKLNMASVVQGDGWREWIV